MAKNVELQNQNEETVDAGAIIASWETWDAVPVERGTTWYVVMTVIGLGLLLYAILNANFIFAAIIIMFAGLMLVKDIRKPNRVKAHVTTAGIVYGDEFHPYDSLKNFAVVYKPPEVKHLYVTFQSRLSPMLSIPLEDADPNQVRQGLLPYLLEDLKRDDESLTDILTRLYKL